MPTRSICATGRPLVDEYHQHVVLDLQAHVAEKAGGEQRAQGLLAFLLVHGLADLDRQVAEHGARLGALQALDADVLDDEGAEMPARNAARREQSNAQTVDGEETLAHHYPETARLMSL
jgi:hypothetical protein